METMVSCHNRKEQHLVMRHCRVIRKNIREQGKLLIIIGSFAVAMVAILQMQCMGIQEFPDLIKKVCHQMMQKLWEVVRFFVIASCIGYGILNSGGWNSDQKAASSDSMGILDEKIGEDSVLINGDGPVPEMINHDFVLINGDGSSELNNEVPATEHYNSVINQYPRTSAINEDAIQIQKSKNPNSVMINEQGPGSFLETYQYYYGTAKSRTAAGRTQHQRLLRRERRANSADCALFPQNVDEYFCSGTAADMEKLKYKMVGRAVSADEIALRAAAASAIGAANWSQNSASQCSRIAMSRTASIDEDGLRNATDEAIAAAESVGTAVNNRNSGRFAEEKNQQQQQVINAAQKHRKSSGHSCLSFAELLSPKSLQTQRPSNLNIHSIGPDQPVSPLKKKKTKTCKSSSSAIASYHDPSTDHIKLCESPSAAEDCSPGRAELNRKADDFIARFRERIRRDLIQIKLTKRNNLH